MACKRSSVRFRYSPPNGQGFSFVRFLFFANLAISTEIKAYGRGTADTDQKNQSV